MLKKRIVDKKGFTLIEVLIAIAIFGLVIGAIYGIYINSMKTSESQRLTSEMQQNARAGLEYMTRELNLAGFGVSNSPGNTLTGSTCAAPTAAAVTDNYISGIGWPANDCDSGPKLSVANAGEIVFTYKDLSISESTYRTVRYYLSGNNLQRDSRLYNSATWTWDASTSGNILIDNVQSLSFTYFDANNASITPTTQALRSGVRRVTASLTTQGSKADPVTGTTKTYTLSTDVALINMQVATVVNPTPPTTPAISSVSDPHICGSLDVYWTKSPIEPDLGGYLIEVTSGTNIRQYTMLPTVTQGRVGGVYTKTVSGATTYSYPIADSVSATVKMRAYNTSGYYSAYSNVVTSTPIANAPRQPLGLDATADTVNGASVTLTWTDNSISYSNCSVGSDCDNDVKGYKVYRRVYGAVTWPAAPIADETTVTKASYTDSTITPQDRCTTFEYKINAVNGCNTTLVSVDSASVYGDGARTGGITDSPTNGVTNTRPSDSTAPAAPTITASKAGYRRDYINWTNPGDSDLYQIVMRYNSQCGAVAAGQCGSGIGLTSPPSTTTGTALEDAGSGTGILSPETPGVAGRSITHTGTIGGSPSLGATCLPSYIATYAYSFFAVDRCGNGSACVATSAATVAQCGEAVSTDVPRTQCQEGAPGWSTLPVGCTSPTSAGFAVSNSCGANYTFSWNRINDSPSNVWDLAGYYAYRNPTTGAWTPSSLDTTNGLKASGLLLNPGSGSVSWSDTGVGAGTAPSLDDSIMVGNTYKYYVIPIDCNRQSNLSGDPWASYAPSPTPAPAASNVLTVTPGRVQFTKPIYPATYALPADPYITTGDLTIGAVSPYTASSATNYLHNTASFYIYNTSAGKVSLDSFTVSWVNASAYLSKVERLDTNACVWGTSLGCATQVASPQASGMAGVTISPAIQFQGITSAGSCPTAPCSLKFKLTFTNASGGVSVAQDIRNATLSISNLNYTKTFKSDLVDAPSLCAVASPKIYTGAADNVITSAYPIAFATQEIYGALNTVSVPSQTPGGHNIASTNDVNVTANITVSGAGITLSQVYLYYRYTGQNVTTPPTDYNNYTALPMYQTAYNAGTNAYTYVIYKDAFTGSKIPARKDKRIWYFILVKDSQGNWDRDPEISDTVNAYTYDQDNPCNNTPNSPTTVAGAPEMINRTLNAPSVYGAFDVDASGKINLIWNAPATNTDSTALNDLLGFNIYQYTSSDKGATWTLSSATPVATVSGTTPGATYTAAITPAAVSGTWLGYSIKAYDECALTAKESSDPIPVPLAKPLIKGMCSAAPGITSVDTINSTIYASPCGVGPIYCIAAIKWDMPADTDLKGFNIYSTPFPYGVGLPSPTSNTGYTLAATVTLTGAATCASTVGTCSILANKVTVTLPANTWNWSNYYHSVRAFDYCNLEGNRGTEW